MYRFRREGHIEAPPQQVFDFATDQTRLPEWSPEVARSEVIGGGPVQAGAVLRQVRKQGGREMTNEVEVTLHEPPSRHVVRAKLMGVEARFAFEFQPEGNGTHVTFDCQVAPANLLARLWSGKIGKIIEKADDKRLEQLAAAMSRWRS